MGCGSSNDAKDSSSSSGSSDSESEEEQTKKESGSLANDGVMDEKQIKIFSEMLVNENKEDYRKYYDIIDTIGQGAFGKVYKVKQKATGKIFALKLIKKETDSSNDLSNKNFLNEVYILRKLDHPNILKIYEFFSNAKFWFFVMDYCSGGELYEQICNMKYYSETTAAYIMKQIFGCVSYLHTKGIVHRDLKPENMMVNSTKDNIEIKMIDFGTATFVQKDKKLTLKVGSPFYIAPEVLRGSYNIECDLWSCGVIMYVLLAGYPPFDGKTPNEIFKNILQGDYPMEGEEWEHVSYDAKDLIIKLLEKKVSKRITAADALKHPFIVKNCKKKLNTEKGDKKFNKISLKNSLYNFSSKQKLHQAAVAFIVHQMSNSKMVDQLKEIFKELDESGEGLLSKEELQKGFSKYFADDISEQEFEEIMKLIDQDDSGEISIEEFLRATMDYENLTTEKNLKLAFDYFDKDHSGTLSPDEIREVLGLSEDNEKSRKIVNDIIEEVDENGDGLISFDEFKKMMKANKELLSNPSAAVMDKQKNKDSDEEEEEEESEEESDEKSESNNKKKNKNKKEERSDDEETKKSEKKDNDVTKKPLVKKKSNLKNYVPNQTNKNKAKKVESSSSSSSSSSGSDDDDDESESD
jgi:calcium-dependent protein kinase